MWTNEKHISWARMSEIAAVLKDGLIEDGMEEAYRYMADVAELSDSEAEYFRLDMERCRDFGMYHNCNRLYWYGLQFRDYLHNTYRKICVDPFRGCGRAGAGTYPATATGGNRDCESKWNL